MAKLKVLKANQNHYEDMVSIDHSITSTHAYRMQRSDAKHHLFVFNRQIAPEAH